MAFEADYGVSTVLEEIRVASTVRFLVPGKWWVFTAVPCAATSLFLRPVSARFPRGAQSRATSQNPHGRFPRWQIRNPKSEIRNSASWLAYTRSCDRLITVASVGPLGRAPPDAGSCSRRKASQRVVVEQ